MRFPQYILTALAAAVSFAASAGDASPAGTAPLGNGWTPDPDGYADPQGIAFTKGKSDLVLCLMSGDVSDGARRRADRSLLSYSGDTCRPRKTRCRSLRTRGARRGPSFFPAPRAGATPSAT